MKVRSQQRSIGSSTLRFALATGAARIVALAREILAARYFGVTPAMSAFTVAFQIPNLLRSLFADSALQGAVVPVLGDLQERGKRGEAIQTLNGLFTAITLTLGVGSILFVFLAHPVIAVVAPGLASHSGGAAPLAANLARIMFPVVMLISLSGVVAGALNTMNEFSLPALAPALWNAVIVAALFIGAHFTPSRDRIYVYAAGVVGGSLLQLVLLVLRLRAHGVVLRFSLRRNEHVARIARSMLPITVALGLMNISLLLDSFFGSLISTSAPAAIDKAFRLIQLPQGIFSVAVATIMFPALVRSAALGDLAAIRRTTASGIRLITFLMLPCAVVIAVLTVPIVHGVYQRGAFDAAATKATASAVRWWAVALPLTGASTFMWRVLFSLDERKVAIVLTGANIAVNVLVSALLYGPLRIAGDVIGTVSGTAVMAALQGVVLLSRLGAQNAWRVALLPLAGMFAGSGASGIVAFVLGSALRPGPAASSVVWGLSATAAITASLAAYCLVTAAIGVPEARSAIAAIRRFVIASRQAVRERPAQTSGVA